jgi:hypothetical protein
MVVVHLPEEADCPVAAQNLVEEVDFQEEVDFRAAGEVV